MLTSVKNKLRRLLAMVISVFLVAGVVMPVEAQALESPYDSGPLATHLEGAYAFGYGGLLDLRLLNEWAQLQDGTNLSLLDLSGVDQLWETSADNKQAANTSTIDLEALGLITLDLGYIPLPLVGENGLLEFVLGNAQVGALREYARAPFASQAHGAAGVVSDSGGLELTQPGDGLSAKVDILSLLKLSGIDLIKENVITEAALELGAISAVAKAPDMSDVPEQTAPTCDSNLDPAQVGAPADDRWVCSGYQVADAQLILDSPLVGNVATDLNETLAGLLETAEDTLNTTLGTDGVLDLIYAIPLVGTVLQGVVDISLEADIPAMDITSALLLDPLTSSDGLVSIDLGSGRITVDLKQLHGGNLNGLEPNTLLLSGTELTKITETVTGLLTDPKEEEPNGLNARLDNILRGENGQGGLYATEVKLHSCVLGLLPNTCLLQADTYTTLGGLLNPDIQRTNSQAVYEANPYDYYYVDGTLGAILGGVIQDLLGGVGPIVEGLLFGESTGLLGGILGNLQTEIISPLLTDLNPVLIQVLGPIANIKINRQITQEVAHGTVFTVSALEVNVLDLGTSGEAVHLPLATASVMAQPPLKMDFDVAKVGGGRNLYTGGYTYDLVCTVEEDGVERQVVNKTGPEESIIYPADKVGDGFFYEPTELSLTGETGGLPQPIRISPGAQCTVTGTADTLTTLYPALRPTGDGEGTRTPYTYFLDVDAEDGVLVSGGTSVDGLTALNPIPMTSSGSVSPNTDNVGNEWKNHSFTFTVPAGKDIHRVSIVHAYDIDTRDITLSKTTTGPAPEGQSYSFQYSLDEGNTWLPQSPDSPITVAADGSYPIEGVPVLDLQELNSEPSAQLPTKVMIRELVELNSQHVTWELDGAALNSEYESDGTVQYALTKFTAGPVADAAIVPTPDMTVGVTNSYVEVSVDKHIDGLLSVPLSDTTLLPFGEDEMTIRYTVTTNDDVNNVTLQDSSLGNNLFVLPEGITVDADGTIHGCTLTTVAGEDNTYSCEFTVTFSDPEAPFHYEAYDAVVTATVTKTIDGRTVTATATDKHGAMRLSDLVAMLPNTGATTLVWVLGLGVLVALAALANYIRSRRN